MSRSFKCDWENCERKPFAEVYKEHGWNYLCFFHFLLSKILRHRYSWCRIDSDREILEEILEEIYTIQYDLIDLKEEIKRLKNGIKRNN